MYIRKLLSRNVVNLCCQIFRQRVSSYLVMCGGLKLPDSRLTGVSPCQLRLLSILGSCRHSRRQPYSFRFQRSDDIGIEIRIGKSGKKGSNRVIDHLIPVNSALPVFVKHVESGLPDRIADHLLDINTFGPANQFGISVGHTISRV